MKIKIGDIVKTDCLGDFSVINTQKINFDMAFEHFHGLITLSNGTITFNVTPYHIHMNNNQLVLHIANGFYHIKENVIYMLQDETYFFSKTNISLGTETGSIIFDIEIIANFNKNNIDNMLIFEYYINDISHRIFVLQDDGFLEIIRETSSEVN
jgi:hypothetical protein